MGFASFLGNPRAVEALRAMLGSGRVPGAILFTGPEGVGKKTLALMFAQAQVCERGGADFCGRCAACRKAARMFTAAQEDTARRREIKDAARCVEGLAYFDLHLIEPLTRFILTEQVRQARAVAYTQPFELRRRVLIFDAAQTIHWQASDMLLKLLEEPPETTGFILISANPFELRSTIRSRCLRVNFQLVEEVLIREVVGRARQLEAHERALAARLAAGSVAKALTFDLAEYQRRRQPWLDFFSAAAPSRPGGPAPDMRQLLDSARALAGEREDFEGALEIGYSLLADLLKALLGSAGGMVNLDLSDRLKELAPRLAFEGIARLTAGLDQARRLEIRNVNLQLGFEALGLEAFSRLT